MKGFTYLELILVVALTLIIFTMGTSIYGNLLTITQIHDSSKQITYALRLAQLRSNHRLNNSQHGVYFEINTPGDDRFILYQGNDYSSRDISFDQVNTLGPALSISTTFTGDEINFTAGTGSPDQTGIITLTHSTSGNKNIIVNQLGMVE